MRRRLLEPEQARAAADRAGAAVSGSGLRPSSRSSASTTFSAPRNRRASASRGTPISAPMVLRPSRSSVRTVSASRRRAATGSGARYSALSLRERVGERARVRSIPLTPLSFAESPSPAGERRIARQRPSRRRRRRNRHAHSQPKRRKPPPHIATSPCSPPNRCATPLTSSRSPSPSTSTSGDQRPAHFASRSHQRRIAFGIGRNRDQRRVERARIGQPRAGPRAAFGGGFGDGMDDRPVRALDGEDDRRVRRCSRCVFAQRSIASLGNQMEAIRFMGDASTGRAAVAACAEQLGIPRRRPRRARVEIVRQATARSRSASASARRSNWRGRPAESKRRPRQTAPQRRQAAASR